MHTPTPALTPTGSGISTPTFTPTPTNTATATHTDTPTPIDTATPSHTDTPAPIDTATPTLTYTATPTLTYTHTPTPTPTFADTPAPTQAPSNLGGGCPSEPQPGCKETTNARKGFLYVRRQEPVAANKVVWGWAKGEAVSSADIGDPTAGTSYELCIYDHPNGQANLLVDLAAPAGPAWVAVKKGYLYVDAHRASDGIGTIKVVSGPAGSARLSLKASGEHMPVADPSPLHQSLVVAQMWNSNGTCWTTQFTSPARKVKLGLFSDYAD